jgi:hypothetical protein
VLGVTRLDREDVTPTLGAVLKERDDIARAAAMLEDIFGEDGG